MTRQFRGQPGSTERIDEYRQWYETHSKNGASAFDDPTDGMSDDDCEIVRLFSQGIQRRMRIRDALRAMADQEYRERED